MRKILSYPYVVLAAAVLIVSLFFSYRPTISLGIISGTNLEIGFSQIGAALFIITCIPLIWQNRRMLRRHVPLLILSSLSLFSTVSLFYTPNLARGVLFTTLLWALTALWVAMASAHQTLLPYKKALIIVLFWSVSIVAVFSWFQVFADAMGISTTVTLLPSAYTAAVFGFARPTGFALEPQFLGSLMIAPLLYTAYLELTGRASRYSRVLFCASLSVLIATLSRGAYLATSIGIVILLVAYGRANIRHIATLAAFGLSTVLVTAGLLAAAAQLNTRDSIDAQAAIAGSVNQITLGAVALPSQPPEDQASPVTPIADSPTQSSGGYVATSTDSRLQMSDVALTVWRSNPATVLFGVGSGGFGATVHAIDATYPISSVVNNQYIETLVELGLIGTVLFISVVLTCLYAAIRRRTWHLAAIIVALSLQWLFFSGNVNVLHIWVLLAVAYAYLTLPHEKTTISAL